MVGVFKMAGYLVSAMSLAFPILVDAQPCINEDVGGTVMPHGSGESVEVISARFRIVKEWSGILRFTMSGPGHNVRLTGMRDVSYYAELGRKIRAVQDRVAKHGIKVGYKMLPTTNCGIKHPFTKFTYSSGAVREFTACPGDENFRRDFAAKCAALAKEAKPFLYLVDDDFRYHADGCWCERHLRRFSALSGISPNRKAVLTAIYAKDEKGKKNRTLWHKMHVNDLILLAKAASDAVYAVSPETRMGICAPGRFPERDTARIARALAAGRHRPVIRWWSSAYGYDNPIEMSGMFFSAQWAKENLPQDIECILEADPIPNSRFYASASRFSALISTALASGYSAALYNAMGDPKSISKGTADHIALHKRNLERFAAVKREAAKGRLVGVQTFFDADSRVGGGSGDGKRPFDPEAWYRSFNRLGIPLTTAEAPVKLACGHHAFRTMDDEAVKKLLSGNVILDGAAAVALQERGFGHLIGVKVSDRDKIDFNYELHTGFVDKYTWTGTTFHQNYGLDNGPVARLELLKGAKSVTVYGQGEKYQPATSYYENELGGKVAVTALHMAWCKSPSFFCPWKRDMFVKLFRKMGGERIVPARILDRGNMMLFANDGDERLFLHAVNISCDPVDYVKFEIVAPYSGGKVEILGTDGTWQKADVRWKGDQLAVKLPDPVNVYGFFDLRIKPNGKVHKSNR